MPLLSLTVSGRLTTSLEKLGVSAKEEAEGHKDDSFPDFPRGDSCCQRKRASWGLGLDASDVGGGAGPGGSQEPTWETVTAVLWSVVREPVFNPLVDSIFLNFKLF